MVEDWDDLLDVDTEDYRDNPEQEMEENTAQLGEKEAAHVETSIKRVSTPRRFDQDIQNRAKEAFERVAKGRVRVETGACQPETDGDLACQFKLSGPVEVQVDKNPDNPLSRDVKVPVNPDGVAQYKDFDEARAHEVNEIRREGDRTVVS